MKRIVMASLNPVKLNAVLQGFQRMFPEEQFETITINVPSGVSDQPMSDGETLQGAINRSAAASMRIPEADYWVGIEGGVDEQDEVLQAFAWVVIKSNGLLGKSRTATFELPNVIRDLVRSGVELGEADDLVFKRQNSKQANGAIGILTQDVIDRTAYYEHAVILALVPFRNHDLFLSENV